MQVFSYFRGQFIYKYNKLSCLCNCFFFFNLVGIFSRWDFYTLFTTTQEYKILQLSPLNAWSQIQSFYMLNGSYITYKPVNIHVHQHFRISEDSSFPCERKLVVPCTYFFFLNLVEMFFQVEHLHFILYYVGI